MTDQTHDEGDNRIKSLSNYLDGIEHLIEDRSDVNARIKDLKDQAVSEGFDLTTITEMLKLRKLDPDLREERETLRDLYASKLGLI